MNNLVGVYYLAATETAYNLHNIHHRVNSLSLYYNNNNNVLAHCDSALSDSLKV